MFLAWSAASAATVGVGVRAGFEPGQKPDAPRVAIGAPIGPLALRLEAEADPYAAPSPVASVLGGLGIPVSKELTRTVVDRAGLGALVDWDFGVRGDPGRVWFSPHLLAGWRGAVVSSHRLAADGGLSEGTFDIVTGPVVGCAGTVRLGRFGARLGFQQRWALGRRDVPGSAITLDLVFGI